MHISSVYECICSKSRPRDTQSASCVKGKRVFFAGEEKLSTTGIAVSLAREKFMFLMASDYGSENVR